MQKILVFLHTLLYLCISQKFSDLSLWLSSHKQDISYQLALQSVLEFILNIFLLSMWKKKKEISINSHFMLYFVP